MDFITLRTFNCSRYYQIYIFYSSIKQKPRAEALHFCTELCRSKSLNYGLDPFESLFPPIGHNLVVLKLASPLVCDVQFIEKHEAPVELSESFPNLLGEVLWFLYYQVVTTDVSKLEWYPLPKSLPWRHVQKDVPSSDHVNTELGSGCGDPQTSSYKREPCFAILDSESLRIRVVHAYWHIDFSRHSLLFPWRLNAKNCCFLFDCTPN